MTSTISLAADMGPIDISELKESRKLSEQPGFFQDRYYLAIQANKDGEDELFVKKLNCFQTLMRKWFGQFKETHATTIAQKLCDKSLSLVRSISLPSFEKKLNTLAGRSLFLHPSPINRRDQEANIQKAIQENLSCRPWYDPEQTLPFLDPKAKYQAFSREEVEGKSFLVFLQGNIADKQVFDPTRKVAVVNAANEWASPSGGGVTGALSQIADRLTWKRLTKEAKGGFDRELEVGECLSIQKPFTKDIGVQYLFHSLGRRYKSQASLRQISDDLQKVYKAIFKKASELGVDTIESPMISGEIFRPDTIPQELWDRLNASFFTKAADEWLQEKSGRVAILIGLHQLPQGDFR